MGSLARSPSPGSETGPGNSTWKDENPRFTAGIAISSSLSAEILSADFMYDCGRSL